VGKFSRPAIATDHLAALIFLVLTADQNQVPKFSHPDPRRRLGAFVPNSAKYLKFMTVPAKISNKSFNFGQLSV
jgi:hypothetical protein